MEEFVSRAKKATLKGFQKKTLGPNKKEKEAGNISKKEEKAQHDKKLHVSFPKGAHPSKQSVQAHFEQFGEVKEIFMKPNTNYFFVTFDSAKSADEAMRSNAPFGESGFTFRMKKAFVQEWEKGQGKTGKEASTNKQFSVTKKDFSVKSTKQISKKPLFSHITQEEEEVEGEGEEEPKVSFRLDAELVVVILLQIW